MNCGVCGSSRLAVQPFTAALRLRGDRVVRSDVCKCQGCGSYIRDLDYSLPDVTERYQLSEETRFEDERSEAETRTAYLRSIRDMALDHLAPSSSPSALDIGCSFGGLMSLFSERGLEVAGVEIVDSLRRRLTEKGFRVTERLEDHPAGRKFDVICFVDSLYYFEQPRSTIRQAHDRLAEGGLVVIRVTNRTSLMGLRHVIPAVPDVVLGDAKYAFSYRGLRSMMENAGFSIARTTTRERQRPASTPLRRLLFALSPLSGLLTAGRLSAGLIIVCRKNAGPVSQGESRPAASSLR